MTIQMNGRSVLYMDFLNIFTNAVLLIPACSWIIAQLMKAVINLIVNKKFSFARLFGDGGMPSGHSATVSALATMVGLYKGFGSVEFAIATLFAIVVMHDALGVRRETGKQAVSIIKMAELLNDYLSEHNERIKTDKLKVLVGHTPWQVVCGAALGAVIAIVYRLVFM